MIGGELGEKRMSIDLASKHEKMRSVLITELKIEIKSLMEIYSSISDNECSINRSGTCLDEVLTKNLCAIIDACLKYGLKTDLLHSTFDLLKCLIKQKHRSPSSLTSSVTIFEEKTVESVKLVINQCNHSMRLNQSSPGSQFEPHQQSLQWIQISISHRLLADIVEYIIEHASDKYYETYSIVTDPCDSRVFHSLLMGLDVININCSQYQANKSTTAVHNMSLFSPAMRLLSSSPAMNTSTSSSNYAKLDSFISPIFNINRQPATANTSLFSLTSSAKKKEKIRRVCVSIESQIVSKVFYAWLKYHRTNKLIKQSLSHLVKFETIAECEFVPSDELESDVVEYLKSGKKLDERLWVKFVARQPFEPQDPLIKLFYKLVYTNGLENSGNSATSELRRRVWPYLFDHYAFTMNQEELEIKQRETIEEYSKLLEDWRPYEQYKSLIDEINLSNTINSFRKFESHKSNLITTTPIKPQMPISLVTATSSSSCSSTSNNLKSIKDEDSGICSDLTSSNSYSSGLSSTKSSALSQQTPVVKTDSLANAPNRFSSLFRNLRINTNTTTSSTGRSRFELFNLRNGQQSVTTTSSNDSTGLINNARSLLNKFMHKEDEDDQLRGVMDSAHTPPVSPVISYPDYEPFGLHLAESSNITNTAGEVVNQVFSSPIYPTSSNDEPEQLSVVPEPPYPVCDNMKLFENFSINMHRIDKDVVRCDRNFWYFRRQENLNKLKNIIYTYVWENMEVGYIQGMCDLIAPLLVIFDDEPIVHACFKQIMKRMCPNFMLSSVMDRNFSSLNYLLSILDPELYIYMNNRYNMNQSEFSDDERHNDSELDSNENHDSGSVSHEDDQYHQYTSQFYFTYRWFLLDFKRELTYKDLFTVWESIWSASHCSTEHFSIFVALALLQKHRLAIIENHMDFTDIIQYFNELSEKHDMMEILNMARNSVHHLQQTIIKYNAN